MLLGSRMYSGEVDPVSGPGGCGAALDTSRGVLAETTGGFHPYHLLSLANDHSSWKKEDDPHGFSGKGCRLAWICLLDVVSELFVIVREV